MQYSLFIPDIQRSNNDINLLITIDFVMNVINIINTKMFEKIYLPSCPMNRQCCTL